MGNLTISQAVQIHNIIVKTIDLNQGIVPGGFDYAYFCVKREISAIQKHCEISKKDINKYIVENGDKPSQVLLSLSPSDLPAKTPAGLSQVLSPVMEQQEINEDYYGSLVKEEPKEEKAKK